MSSTRVDTLKQMLEGDPANTFVRYGLAMEHLNSGGLEEAVAEFRKLLENNPDYAAAYFHGGQTLEKLGKIDDARALYDQGIAVTTRTGDRHTRSELQAALDDLELRSH